MEQTVSLGVWAMTVIAPCIISWLAGDVAGAARTRRLYNGGIDTDPSPSDSALAYQVEQWRLKPSAEMPGGASGEATPALAPQAEPQVEPTFEELAEAAELRRLRREAFAQTPSLTALRERTALLASARTTMLCQPSDLCAEDQILRHYQQSVMALQRENLRLNHQLSITQYPSAPA